MGGARGRFQRHGRGATQRGGRSRTNLKGARLGDGQAREADGSRKPRWRFPLRTPLRRAKGPRRTSGCQLILAALPALLPASSFYQTAGLPALAGRARCGNALGSGDPDPPCASPAGPLRPQHATPLTSPPNFFFQNGTFVSRRDGSCAPSASSAPCRGDGPSHSGSSALWQLAPLLSSPSECGRAPSAPALSDGLVMAGGS